jgi:rod shape-determining protein MreC
MVNEEAECPGHALLLDAGAQVPYDPPVSNASDLEWLGRSLLSLLKRYRDLIAVGFLLLFPFVTFMTRGHRGRDPIWLDRGLLAITSVFQSAFGWVLDGTSSAWRGYVALRGVEAENRTLREQNEALRAQAHSLEEVKAENVRLKDLLTYSEPSPGVEVVARVVGVDPASTRHFVRINRGESDGVRKGMAVVTAAGVVGHVERATSGWADVILLTDATHRMGVRVQRSRARAIAAGVGSKAELRLRMDFALRKDDLQEGDVVITSGTDGVYPAGLKVGTLANVQKRSYGMFQAADIAPAVDTTRLEEVLVLPAVAGTGLATPGTGGAGEP